MNKLKINIMLILICLSTIFLVGCTNNEIENKKIIKESIPSLEINNSEENNTKEKTTKQITKQDKTINKTKDETKLKNDKHVKIKYPYIKDNVTYNLYFHNTIEDIKNMNFPIEITKQNLLNTQNFIMSFDTYKGNTNGEVGIASTKLVSFLQFVYKYDFNQSSFKRITEFDCSDSTKQNKIITFNPKSDREGIFYNQTNGCIQFETQNPKHMADLIDKLIYEYIQE